TPENRPFGFIFLDCKLKGDPTPWQGPAGQPQFEASDVKTYLGRPWRPFASVTYLNCDLGDHIKADGWDNWGKVENEKTARYAEYKSHGPGANPEKRQSWSKQLSDEEAKQFTLANIFKRSDEWTPEVTTR